MSVDKVKDVVVVDDPLDEPAMIERLVEPALNKSGEKLLGKSDPEESRNEEIKKSKDSSKSDSVVRNHDVRMN